MYLENLFIVFTLIPTRFMQNITQRGDFGNSLFKLIKPTLVHFPNFCSLSLMFIVHYSDRYIAACKSKARMYDGVHHNKVPRRIG